MKLHCEASGGAVNDVETVLCNWYTSDFEPLVLPMLMALSQHLTLLSSYAIGKDTLWSKLWRIEWFRDTVTQLVDISPRFLCNWDCVYNTWHCLAVKQKVSYTVKQGVEQWSSEWCTDAPIDLYSSRRQYSRSRCLQFSESFFLKIGLHCETKLKKKWLGMAYLPILQTAEFFCCNNTKELKQMWKEWLPNNVDSVGVINQTHNTRQRLTIGMK